MIIGLELALYLGLNKTDHVEQNLASLPKLLRMLAIKALKETVSWASVGLYCALTNLERRFHKLKIIYFKSSSNNQIPKWA